MEITIGKIAIALIAIAGALMIYAIRKIQQIDEDDDFKGVI